MRAWRRFTTCPTWPRARCLGRRRARTGCDMRPAARRTWVAAVPLLGACYVYQPLVSTDPHPDARLALDLSDQGRAALATNVGSDASRVEGTLVGGTADEYVIREIGRASCRERVE